MSRAGSTAGRRARALRSERGKRRTLAIGAAVAAVVAVAALLVALRPAVTEPLAIREGDPTLGSEQAALDVFFFGDYRCSHCRDYEHDGGMDAFRERYVDTGVVRLVVKDFPILGPDSRTAAAASRQVWATNPDAYWEWHRGLYLQRDLSASGIVEYSRAFEGIDADELARALADARHASAIERNLADGADHGVRSTPTLVIGTRAVTARDAAAVEDALQAALAASGDTP